MLKYLNSISSNRWLIMKIFGVLISFLVFFVVLSRNGGPKRQLRARTEGSGARERAFRSKTFIFSRRK